MTEIEVLQQEMEWLRELVATQGRTIDVILKGQQKMLDMLKKMAEIDDGQ